MWIFLWFLLSAFVIGVSGWSLSILQQQKKAWQEFAKKNNLAYVAGGLTGSPSVSGRLKNHQISLYTDTQQTSDVRGQRFVIVIEVVLGPGMPTGAAIATKEYRDFLASLKMNETYLPQIAGWSPEYIVKTRSREALSRYLTDERAAILHSLFVMKNSMVLFFFDEIEGVLRIETGDPLRNAAHLCRRADGIVLAADQQGRNVDARKLWGNIRPLCHAARRGGNAFRVASQNYLPRDLDRGRIGGNRCRRK